MKFRRELLRDAAGYVPGEQPGDPEIIKLNTNECPYPPSPRVLEAIRGVTPEQLRKYPDPVSRKFREACAARYGYPDADWIVIGNGMDELLALALRTFVDPGDTVVTAYPSYSLYDVLCKLHGCSLLQSNLDDAYQLDASFFALRGRLCFLTRPNAPSGVAVPRPAVERLCREFPGIVVIDEAYADFGDDDCLDFPQRFENAIVMRTFSKSHSLAGMRIGVAAARPALIEEFLKTKDSYNMNAASQAAGLAAIEDTAHMRANVDRVRASRERLRAELLELGFAVPPSSANFLLARRTERPHARELFAALRERKILVRYFDAPGLTDCLRITVGTDAECDALTSALRELVRG